MILDHTGRDTNSHLLKHSIESGRKPLEAVDYKIIEYLYPLVYNDFNFILFLNVTIVIDNFRFYLFLKVH